MSMQCLPRLIRSLIKSHSVEAVDDAVRSDEVDIQLLVPHMKKEIVHQLTETFEGHAQLTENGVEYWLARDLQQLLGYSEWRNFVAVVTKAKTACEISGHAVADHFVDVTKMVDIGSGVQREIDDVMLTRYACYLVAQNGDPKKQEIAFAQTYFAMQTRRAELIEQRLLEVEREPSGRSCPRLRKSSVRSFTSRPEEMITSLSFVARETTRCSARQPRR